MIPSDYKIINSIKTSLGNFAVNTTSKTKHSKGKTSFNYQQKDEKAGTKTVFRKPAVSTNVSKIINNFSKRQSEQPSAVQSANNTFRENRLIKDKLNITRQIFKQKNKLSINDPFINRTNDSLVPQIDNKTFLAIADNFDKLEMNKEVTVNEVLVFMNVFI